MTHEPPLTDDERRLLEQKLPWYLNASLAPDECQWVEQLLGRSTHARQLLEGERALKASAPSMLAWAPPHLGLAQLMERVASERRTVAAPRSPWSAVEAFFRGGLAWVSSPRVAAAMAVMVVVQTAALTWLALPNEPVGSELRSVPATEVRTLRVTFSASASEAQVRQVLLSASARIVGGPNQLGEYWVASESLSLQDLQTRLSKVDVVESATVDLAGPRGR